MSGYKKISIYINFIVITFSLCFPASISKAEEMLEFNHYLTKESAPSPPRNLRIIGGHGVVSYKDEIEDLKDKDPQIRKNACFMLLQESMNLKAFIHELASELNNEDVIVRRHITAILKIIGPDSFAATDDLIIALKDPDELVRLNAIGALGKIGRNASYAAPGLIEFLREDDPKIRAYAAGALGLIGPETSSAIPALIDLFNDRSYLVRKYAIIGISSMGPEAIDAVPALINLIENGIQDDVKYAALALSRIANTLNDAGAVDSIEELRKAEIALNRSNNDSLKEYVMPINRAIKYLSLKREENIHLEFDETKISFLEKIPKELITDKQLIINGEKLNISRADIDKNTLYFLGENNILNNGFNYFDCLKKRYYFWLEENKLKKFELPYKSSFAIIVAIDDYKRDKGSNSTGPSGFNDLSHMVEHAKQLVNELILLGFPKENILELYNENATSDAVNNALYKFWKGGEHQTADRLLFYFGGHGNAEGKTGYLVTYDYNPQKPTLSSVLMRDLTIRHFENVRAHHFLVALDSCSSGLALPQFQSLDTDERRLKAFRSLSIIRGETKEPARNILVAGTGEQRALWENGGIFTQSFKDGLKGAADYNGDRIIQFSELSLYIKNNVRAKANATGVDQDPDDFQADKFGHGNILFLRQ